MARMGGAKEHSAAFWPVLFLALLSWLVLLAGVSALEHVRNSEGVVSAGTGGVGYSWQWWVVVFEFITLCGVFHGASWGHHETGRVAIVAFLTIATVLLMYESNSYYVLHHSLITPHHRITTYFCGAFLCAIFNLLLIIFLGTTAFQLHPIAGGRHGTTTTKTTNTGATTTV